MTEHRHCLIQTAKLSIHLQKSIASEQVVVEAILDHNCMHHATVLPRTQVSITRNQAHKRGLSRLCSIHIPHVVKQPHDLAQAPSGDVSTNYRIPRHRVPSWHFVEHPACGAHVTEQCSGLKREAQGEVSPEHGVVEERLGRRRGGGRHDSEVKRPARGIRVAKARVAGDEEGREVAVGGEVGDSGEQVRVTRVAAGVAWSSGLAGAALADGDGGAGLRRGAPDREAALDRGARTRGRSDTGRLYGAGVIAVPPRAANPGKARGGLAADRRPHMSVNFKYQKNSKNSSPHKKNRYKVRKNLGKLMEVGNPIWRNFCDYNFLRFSTDFELSQRF
jgi:hypothetical protein